MTIDFESGDPNQVLAVFRLLQSLLRTLGLEEGE
jgi:hypothetical protein